ncbi:MAG: peptide ABC transporter substrate-binding protein [Dehalococcoidia bacterium]
MSTEHPETTQSGPVWDEVEQLSRFQDRLASIKVDRRMAMTIFAAAGGAAGLAACGSSNNNKSNTAKATTTTAATTAASAAATGTKAPAVGSAPAGVATAARTAAPGGSPVAAAATKPSQQPAPPPAGTKLAPAQTFNYNATVEPLSFDFNQNLYCLGDSAVLAGLMKFNPDLEPEPDIAEKFDVSPDGMVFTFHIRKSPPSKWSDGTPVTAKDFDYSFRRQLDPATKAPYSGFLADIKNAKAFSSGKIPDSSTLGLKLIDDYTLQITTEQPAAYLPALLAYASALPAYKPAVDKAGVKWANEASTMVSNGAFTLTKWDHNKSFELTKNDGYWNAKNITLTKIVRPIIGADQATAAYENGEIDYSDRVNASDYKRIFGDAKLSKEYIKYSLDGTWYLVPEADKEPFTDPKVRLAIAHAVDRDSIIKNVLNGVGSPAFTFNPPGTPGFNPATYDEFTKFDPAAAKASLVGTKYEGGKNWPAITMTQRNNEGNGPALAGDAIIQMLGDTLGMKIDHELGDPTQVYQRMWQRKLQLIWLRWYEDYPDANDEENLVFDSQSGLPNGHRQAWHDDNYDKLVRQAAGTTDVKKRAALYAQADQIMAQQAGAIFVYYAYNIGLVKPYLQGMPKDRSGAPVPSWNIFVRMYDFMYITAH